MFANVMLPCCLAIEWSLDLSLTMGDGALQNNIKWGGIDGVKIVKIR